MTVTRTIRLLLTYDGTSYQGWQRQQNGPTIQQTIEEQLNRMTGESISLHGAGRTDSGVHALGMTAHFKTTSTIDTEVFSRGLNAMLPRDIRVLKASQEDDDFHSRYDAKAKTYRFNFFTGPIQLPTDVRYQAHYPGPFFSKQVDQCLKLLRGTHDFSSFEAVGSRDLSRTGGRGATRTILAADCLSSTFQPQSWSFFFTGDGFLRHMVRNLVGTLMLVGQDKISFEGFQKILAMKDRSHAGATAPAHGLFQVRTWYEEPPTKPHPKAIA